MEEKEIVIHDNEIKAKQEKSHLLGGFGFLLILFGLISFGYKNGSHGISDIFTWITLASGILLIVFLNHHFNIGCIFTAL